MSSSTVSWNQKAIWLLLAAAGIAEACWRPPTGICRCGRRRCSPLLWVLPLSVYPSYCPSWRVPSRIGRLVCSRPVWSVRDSGLATLLICFVLYHPETGILQQILTYSFALLASCMVCHGASW